jgi:hypothetical protein
MNDLHVLNNGTFSDSAKTLIKLNVACMRSKGELESSLIEVIRAGYGLVGDFQKDCELLYRLYLLEEGLKEGRLKESVPDINSDYFDRDSNLNKDIVWDYFSNFKSENPYYKRFRFIIDNVPILNDPSFYKKYEEVFNTKPRSPYYYSCDNNIPNQNRFIEWPISKEGFIFELFESKLFLHCKGNTTTSFISIKSPEGTYEGYISEGLEVRHLTTQNGFPTGRHIILGTPSGKYKDFNGCFLVAELYDTLKLVE